MSDVLDGRLRTFPWAARLIGLASLGTLWGLFLLWWSRFAWFPGAFFVVWIGLVWGLTVVQARRTVVRFRLDPERLSFRLLGGRNDQQVALADVTEVALIPRTRVARAFELHAQTLASRPRFELHDLENSDLLLPRLQVAQQESRWDALERHRATLPGPAAPRHGANPQLDAALTQRLQAILRPDERVLWVGRPNPGRLWNEIGGEFAMGVVLVAFASLPFIIFARLGLPPVQNDGDRMGMLFLFGVFGVFGSFGVYGLLSPRRMGKKARTQTLYAITNKRALIRHAISPGNGTLRQEHYEFTPDQLLDYRTAKNRDLLLGTEWRRGRRLERAVPIGFLGLDDFEGAKAALDRLIAGG